MNNLPQYYTPLNMMINFFKSSAIILQGGKKRKLEWKMASVDIRT